MALTLKTRFTITFLALFITIAAVYHILPIFRTNTFYYDSHAEFLPSIMNSSPNLGKSIFFLETSRNSEKSGKTVITPREACAVESAARQNPTLEVYLIYLSSGTVKHEGTESDRLLQVLQSYQNVRLRHADVEEYFSGSPVENLWRSGRIQGSSYFVSHLSDVLRFLTLWRYGGIYLDLDVIVLKSLENLPLNFAGAESDHSVGSSVLSFEPTGDGHILAQFCLDYLKDNFDGKVWGANGPQVITYLAKSQCGSDNVSELSEKKCGGNFTVYPLETFFPLEWPQWEAYFNESYLPEMWKLVEKSYVIHMWNKLSSKRKVKCGEKVPYAVFAEEFCPNIYAQCQGEF